MLYKDFKILLHKAWLFCFLYFFCKPTFGLLWPPMASNELFSQTYIPYMFFYVFLSILTFFFWAVLLTFYLTWPPEICNWPLWPLKPIWCRFVYMYIYIMIYYRYLCLHAKNHVPECSQLGIIMFNKNNGIITISQY